MICIKKKGWKLFCPYFPPANGAVFSGIFDPNLHVVLLTDHLDVLALKQLGWLELAKPNYQVRLGEDIKIIETNLMINNDDTHKTNTHCITITVMIMKQLTTCIKMCNIEFLTLTNTTLLSFIIPFSYQQKTRGASFTLPSDVPQPSFQWCGPRGIGQPQRPAKGANQSAQPK